MTQEDIADFTETVMTKQTRLMNNNYTELTAETVTEIYKSYLSNYKRNKEVLKGDVMPF